MEFIEKIQSVITKPKEFFAKIKKDKGIKDAFIFFITFTIITNIVYSIYMFRIFSISPEYSEIGAFALPAALVSAIVVIIIGAIGIFIGTGIIHLFVKLMKGKNPFSETFKALVYADTPHYFLSIVILLIYIFLMPGIGSAKIGTEITTSIITLIISLPIIAWTVYLRTIGIAKLQNLTNFKSFAAVFLIPLGVGVILMILGALLFVGLAGMAATSFLPS